jgi:hypothetical protein
LNKGEVHVEIAERALPDGLQKMGDGYCVLTKNKHGVRIIKKLRKQENTY